MMRHKRNRPVAGRTQVSYFDRFQAARMSTWKPRPVKGLEQTPIITCPIRRIKILYAGLQPNHRPAAFRWIMSAGGLPRPQLEAAYYRFKAMAATAQFH